MNPPRFLRPAGITLLLLSASAMADDGRASFLKRCAVCHQAAGQGVPGHFPPLTGMEAWLNSDAGRTYIARVVVQGLAGPIQVQGQNYNALMLTYRGRMQDAELVSVLRYVAETLNTPGPGYRPFDAALISAARNASRLDSDTMALRAQLPAR